MSRAITATLLGLALLTGAAVAVAAPPPKPNTITLAAKPNPLSFGGVARLSGQLAGPSNGGVRLTLQVDAPPFADGDFVTKATATTSSNGRYSFSQAPIRNNRYRVVAAASPKVTSPIVRLDVAYGVGLRVSTSTPHAGSRVRFSGSVGPRKDGASAFVQKRRPDGGFVTVARASLTPGTESRSIYSIRLRIASTATYRVRVSGDDEHVAGVSRSRTLVVR